MPAETRRHKAQVGSNLTPHYSRGTWYGYKRMVRGRTFYGPTSNPKDRIGAAQATAYFAAAEAEGVALKAAGLGWTTDALQRVEALKPTKIAPQTLVPHSVVPTASGSPSTSAAATTVAEGFAAFEADLFQRVAAKEIVMDTAAAVSERLKSITDYLSALPSGHAGAGFLTSPLRSVGSDQLTAVVRYFRSRPKSPRTGVPISATYAAVSLVAGLRQAFHWFYSKERWDGYRNWEAVFRIDVDQLMTEAEHEEADASGKKRYNLAELSALYATANLRQRLFLLLALNTAATQKEIATLRQTQCKLSDCPPKIVRRRNKTKIPAEWELWTETADLLKQQMRVGKGEGDTAGLVFVTAEGRPLVHRSVGVDQKKNKTDTVAQTWGRLHKATGEALKAAGSDLKVRPLGFKYLRKTAAQMVRDIAGYEVHKVFGAWSTLESGGRRSVSEKHYTDRTEADFNKVNEALRIMRKNLSPMFDAAVAADAAKAAELAKYAADISDLQVATISKGRGAKGLRSWKNKRKAQSPKELVAA